MTSETRRCTSLWRVTPASWYTTSRSISRGNAYPSTACDSSTSVPSQSNPLRSSSSRRSEEHTSELQSPCNLVCRLLLEKKKKDHKLVDYDQYSSHEPDRPD